MATPHILSGEIEIIFSLNPKTTRGATNGETLFQDRDGGILEQVGRDILDGSGHQLFARQRMDPE